MCRHSYSVHSGQFKGLFSQALLQSDLSSPLLLFQRCHLEYQTNHTRSLFTKLLRDYSHLTTQPIARPLLPNFHAALFGKCQTRNTNQCLMGKEKAAIQHHQLTLIQLGMGEMRNSVSLRKKNNPVERQSLLLFSFISLLLLLYVFSHTLMG